MSTVSLTFISEGRIATETTFTLAPQSTPFKPPSGADCERTYLLCSGKGTTPEKEEDSSQWPGMHDGAFRPSTFTCARVSSINPSRAFSDINEDCFPDNYRLIHTSWAFSAGALGLESLVAYPGTACPSGWSRACTVVASAIAPELDVSENQVQVWCCPEGYSCAHHDTKFQDIASQRKCVTQFDDDDLEAYQRWIATEASLTTDFTGSAAPVYASLAQSTGKLLHASVYATVDMIPLAQDDRTETQSGSSPSSLTTTLSTPTGDTSPSLISGGGITGGQIAGIVLGTVAFFALGAAAIFFLLRRKRKPADVPHIEDNSWRTEKEVTQGGPKQELDGREVHVATSGMVDASQQPLAELHEDALVEMEQPVQRVELENQEPESNT